jgi:hypothetical protein
MTGDQLRRLVEDYIAEAEAEGFTIMSTEEFVAYWEMHG